MAWDHTYRNRRELGLKSGSVWFQSFSLLLSWWLLRNTLWQDRHREVWGDCGCYLDVIILGDKPYEIVNMFFWQKWQFHGAHQNTENHVLDICSRIRTEMVGRRGGFSYLGRCGKGPQGRQHLTQVEAGMFQSEGSTDGVKEWAWAWAVVLRKPEWGVSILLKSEIWCH